MQALILALQMVSADLHTSAAGKAGELFFETPGGGIRVSCAALHAGSVDGGVCAVGVRGGGFESRFKRLGGGVESDSKHEAREHS